MRKVMHFDGVLGILYACRSVYVVLVQCIYTGDIQNTCLNENEEHLNQAHFTPVPCINLSIPLTISVYDWCMMKVLNKI